MDGYEKLIKSEQWQKIKSAEAVLWETQASLGNSGIPDIVRLTRLIYEARRKVTEVENGLRVYYLNHRTP